MKVCLIKQHAGLGDILYTLKIARHMLDKGYHIIWPVIREYSFLSDYIKIKNLVFIDENKSFPYKDVYVRGVPVPPREDFIFLPLQTADRLHPNISIIESKYALINLSHENWPDYVELTRNKEKEEDLFYRVLGLKDNEEYTFVNSIYGSPPNSKELSGINYPPTKKVVQLKYIDGYNPFDWGLVLENSKSIYTVDTCFIVIMEKLNIKTNDLHMYSRREYDDFMYQIKPYFTDRWNYKDKNLYLKEN